MFLAGILGLCALLLSPASASDGSRAFSFANQQAPAASQTPAQPPTQDQGQSIHPVEQSPSAQTAAPKKPGPAKKRAAHKKATPGGDQDPRKTVVRKGGTGDKSVQLTPAVNEADASHQREATQQLLTSTDVNLQKLSGRLLSKDEQDTVAQIREFMQQAKTADSKGDLERASKLAAKAHLLSEALANP